MTAQLSLREISLLAHFMTLFELKVSAAIVLAVVWCQCNFWAMSLSNFHTVPVSVTWCGEQVFILQGDSSNKPWMFSNTHFESSMSQAACTNPDLPGHSANWTKILETHWVWMLMPKHWSYCHGFQQMITQTRKKNNHNSLTHTEFTAD